MLGAIIAKLDIVVPKDTHEMIWKNDAEWKRTTEERLDSMRNSVEIVKGGECAWAIEMKKDVKTLREDIDTGKIQWATNLQKDVETLKSSRIPERVFIAIGWIITALIAYFAPHAH
jgi:hypothetical protein